MKDDLIRIQNFLLNFESLFFQAEALPIDYARVNPKSSKYDREYEMAVRQKNLNAPLLLEEILFDQKLVDDRTLGMLWKIEDYLFSSELLRKIVFQQYYCTEFKVLFTEYCKVLEQHIRAFDNNVPSFYYKELINDFKYLSPAPTKAKFLQKLSKFKSLLMVKIALFSEDQFVTEPQDTYAMEENQVSIEYSRPSELIDSQLHAQT